MVFEKGASQNVHVDTRVALDLGSNNLFDTGFCSNIIPAPTKTNLIDEDCPICNNMLPIAGAPVQCIGCNYIFCSGCAERATKERGFQNCFHCRLTGSRALISSNLPACKVEGVVPLIMTFKATYCASSKRFGILNSTPLADVVIDKITDPIFGGRIWGLQAPDHTTVAVFDEDFVYDNPTDAGASNITHLICINTREADLCKVLTTMGRVKHVLRVVTSTAVRDLITDRPSMRKLLPGINLAVASNLASGMEALGQGSLDPMSDVSPDFYDLKRDGIYDLSVRQVYNMPRFTPRTTPYDNVVDLTLSDDDE